MRSVQVRVGNANGKGKERQVNGDGYGDPTVTSLILCIYYHSRARDVLVQVHRGLVAEELEVCGQSCIRKFRVQTNEMQI